MNISKTLNEITLYIDQNLEEKIDYNKIARMLGVNTFTMQRLFSLLTNISLGDYIRRRRLSVAGEDIYNGDKIIDVALKYQYQNATSFSRAFTRFHGIKPSQITKKSELKIFPRLIFETNILPNEEIPYKIKELPSLTLYGTYITTDNENITIDAPLFFKKMEDKYSEKYGPIPYGMTTYQDQSRLHVKAYWILYNKKIDGLSKITIPSTKWLTFQIDSQNSKNIQEMSHKFYMSFLPSCNYNISSLPELEYYHDNITEFLVPLN